MGGGGGGGGGGKSEMRRAFDIYQAWTSAQTSPRTADVTIKPGCALTLFP